jgi:hypothetical protein
MMVTAAVYPEGVNTHPESTYVLAEFDIDMTLATAGPSVGTACGCADQAMALTLHEVRYLDGSDAATLMARPWPECSGVNDPYSSYCYPPDCFTGPNCDASHTYPSTCDAAVPATAVSWGRVKAGYR